MSAVAVYSRVSFGTYLVISTRGITSGDFSFLVKASITVVRTAMSAASRFKSFSGINLAAMSVGTLPFLKPSTLTSFAKRSRAWFLAGSKSLLSSTTLISTRVSDSFLTVVFIKNNSPINFWYYTTIWLWVVVRKQRTVAVWLVPSLISGFKMWCGSKRSLMRA